MPNRYALALTLSSRLILSGMPASSGISWQTNTFMAFFRCVAVEAGDLKVSKGKSNK